MKKLLTASVLGLTVATMGAAWSYAQQETTSSDAASVQQVRGGEEGAREDRRADRGGWKRHGRGGDHRSVHGHDGRKGGMMRQLQAFDLNADGGVTQAEIAQHQQEQIATFDADSDGTLSLDEYQALWTERMRERMVDAFQKHDDDGDGQVTQAEFGDRLAGAFERLDRDGDGTLPLRPRGERPQAPAAEATEATPPAAAAQQ